MKKTSGNLLVSVCFFAVSVVILWLLVVENGMLGLFRGETVLTVCAPEGMCDSLDLFGRYGVFGSILNIVLGLMFSATTLLLGYLYLPSDIKKKLRSRRT